MNQVIASSFESSLPSCFGMTLFRYFLVVSLLFAYWKMLSTFPVLLAAHGFVANFHPFCV